MLRTIACFPTNCKGAKDLISLCLVADPKKRITAEEALNHPWVNVCSPICTPSPSHMLALQGNRGDFRQDQGAAGLDNEASIGRNDAEKHNHDFCSAVQQKRWIYKNNVISTWRSLVQLFEIDPGIATLFLVLFFLLFHSMLVYFSILNGRTYLVGRCDLYDKYSRI
jgi:serine/threonine protein kinase